MDFVFLTKSKLIKDEKNDYFTTYMCFAASMGHAQIANMEYVAVKNTDVAAHIAAEKTYFQKPTKNKLTKETN